MWFHRIAFLLTIIGGTASALAQLPPLVDAQRKPPQVPTQVTRMVVFSIPFAPPADVYPRAVEVQLYASEDGGKTWNLISRADPSQRHFTFRAPRDGEYWFSVRTLNEAGQVTPTTTPKPELHVVVDTVAPKLNLRTWQDEAGELHAAWEMNEPHARPDSLKLMYNTGAANEPWQPIAVQPTPTGTAQSGKKNQTTWQAGTQAEKFFVRAEVTDQAGNTFVTEQEVISNGQLASAGPPNAGAPSTPAPPVAAAQEAVAAAPPATQPWSPESPAEGTAPGVPPMSNTFPVSSATPPDAASTGIAGQPTQTPVDGVPVAGDAMMSPPVASNQSAGVEGGPATDAQVQSVAPDAASSPTMTLVGLPVGVRPRMVNSRRFELEYDVESVGPTGIGRVELWGTRDGGQSWLNFGAPPDQRNPLQVTVDGEGIYGFRIVVYSGSGLGGLPPKSGDQPDVWLGVDLTSPEAKILSAEQGTENRAGELLVSWEASDRMLADRPISLQFSSQPSGPWSTIAAGLPNTGAYVWRLDNRVPDIVYLRMDVRDEAGNVRNADYGQPISIYRQRPAGRITNVRPVTAASQ